MPSNILLSSKIDENLLNWGLVILRVVVGLVFVAHGFQKVTGISGTAGFFGSIGIPAAMLMAVIVTFVELVGGIALIVGAGTRIVAVLLAITMLVAILTVHMANGFFVSDGGFEYALTLLGASLFLALAGPGNMSLDAARGA
ncbi:MAG: DoxX family protein [Ardenticatenaceae bacterium]